MRFRGRVYEGIDCNGSMLCEGVNALAGERGR